jgi:phosphatidylserine/phosphatidylglycerophosphate/cardiolipin synthase-like enzyme
MERILSVGQNCEGVYEVEETGLLIDGQDYYRAFYHAAKRARHYLLMSAWQFDTTVKLLRGREARETRDDVSLLPFLNRLCLKNPELRIYILEWDFSVLFALEREWFQSWIVNWTTSERLRFRFDRSHAAGASHHQKFVVIDGEIAFVGSMDICSGRWDDRRHRAVNLLRVNSNGRPYAPYHEIQSYHIGPVAQQLARLFEWRWRSSGGEDLHLPGRSALTRFSVTPTLRIHTDRVAVSRTLAKTLLPLQDSVQEIRRLYLDAIEKSEELIYIENQYFSSQSIFKALQERIKASDRPRIEIIIVLPKQPEAFLETVSLGMVQARMLYALKELASREGHSIGIYYTGPRTRGGIELPTYVHGKLLLVDDRFLTVGSANTTNRSMGLDSELNVAWEAGSPEEHRLIKSIRKTRISLLSEHTGLWDWRRQRKFGRTKGLVRYLNALAQRGRCRLHPHSMETLAGSTRWLKDLGLEISFDPQAPIVEENIFEIISQGRAGDFSQGILPLDEWVSRRGRQQEPAAEKMPPPQDQLRRRPGWIKWTLAAVVALLLAVLAWVILHAAS